MIFSNVGESIVEVIGIICGGNETKVSVIIVSGLPWLSIFESPSPIVTFVSVLDTFTGTSIVRASS